MLKTKLLALSTVTRIELKKIFASHLIAMTVAAFTALLLIKRGENWTTFSNNALMFLVAVIGLVGFGVISSWVFAREYTDGTFKDLLALPINRATLFAGKLIAIELTAAIVTLLASVITLGLGWLLFPSAITTASVGALVNKIGRTLVLNLLLADFWPLIAVKTKSTIMPAALAFITLIVGIIFASQPLGQVIPWAIPGYLLAHPGNLPIISHLIVWVIADIGILGTLYCWCRQDQA